MYFDVRPALAGLAVALVLALCRSWVIRYCARSASLISRKVGSGEASLWNGSGWSWFAAQARLLAQVVA